MAVVLEENAPAVGQPREAQAITESGGYNATFSPAIERCEHHPTKGRDEAV